MGNRYGRNQKRAHREQIAKLQAERSSAEYRAVGAERRYRSAREDAIREMVKSSPYVKVAMERIGYELGRAMGPHFQEHVEKLMAAEQRRQSARPITFDAFTSADQAMAFYIEGRIEPITYRVAIGDIWP